MKTQINYEEIFKKYLKIENMQFEKADDNYQYCDCSIEFDLKMLDALGIEYIQKREENEIYFAEYRTRNHQSENSLILYGRNNKIWLWAIIQDEFKENRNYIGDYFIIDSEEQTKLSEAYPEIDKTLKEYLTPLLNKLVQTIDIAHLER